MSTVVEAQPRFGGVKRFEQLPSIFTARYAYVRLSFSRGDLEIVVGVQRRSVPCARISEQYKDVREHLQPLADFLLSAGDDDEAIARLMEQAIRNSWPDIDTYFIEVGRGDGSEWVQVFEPGQHNA